MEAIKAVVRKVFPDGRYGSYALATSTEVKGTITFSLDKSVWQEDELPETGMFVLLSNLRQKKVGWRALSGRFFQPSDERQHKTKGN